MAMNRMEGRRCVVTGAGSGIGRASALRFAQEGLPGTLQMTEPTGPETYATVETAVGLLTLRVPGLLHTPVGENVHVAWAPEAVHLFDAATDKRVG